MPFTELLTIDNEIVLLKERKYINSELCETFLIMQDLISIGLFINYLK